MTGRIGFCCKWLSPTRDNKAEEKMNQKGTTITALSKMSKIAILEKLTRLAHHNMDSLHNLLNFVATLPSQQRLLRITSDLLPAYTHEVANWAYKERSLIEVIERGLARAGELAREFDIRITLHPGQFCVLNSVSEGTYQNSLKDFSYHTEIMRMMGYGGRGWHPEGATINIHVGSKSGGIKGLLKGINGLSQDSRNLITIENDELSFGLSSLEELADYVAIVLDIHHEWIFSKGNYISPDDPRIEYVKHSWGNVRPLGHYSISRQDILFNHPIDIQPSYEKLVANGHNIRDLRAHSDMCWNIANNSWAISHLSWMDIEVEAKSKNLASQQLYNQYLAESS